MKEQEEWCDELVARLARLFPEYSPSSFRSNANFVPLGHVLMINMPVSVAERLVNTFEASRDSPPASEAHGD